MEEIQALQAQFMQLQKQAPRTKLSERVCVDILFKLIEAKKVKVYRTNHGKELVTPQKLRREIYDEVVASNGRINIVDLQNLLSIDLSYIEAELPTLLHQNGDLRVFSGQLISDVFLESVVREIDEKLQALGSLNIVEVSPQFDLSTEFLLGVLRPNIERKKVKGRLEGTLLFTSRFLDLHASVLVGFFNACTTPTPVSLAVERFRLHASVVPGIIADLVAGQKVLGTFSADKTVFTPYVFTKNRDRSVEQFYSQNNFIMYEKLRQLHIASPLSYLQQKYPTGIALKSCFLSPTFLHQLEGTVEDAIERNSFTEISGTWPSFLSAEDIESFMDHSQIMQKIILDRESSKSSFVVDQEKGHIYVGPHQLFLSNSYFVSKKFLEEVFAKFSEYFDSWAASHAVQKTDLLRASNDNLRNSQSSSSSPSPLSQSKNEDDDEEDEGPKKKGKGKGKKRSGAKGGSKSSSSSSSSSLGASSDGLNKSQGGSKVSASSYIQENKQKLLSWFTELDDAVADEIIATYNTVLFLMRTNASRAVFLKTQDRSGIEHLLSECVKLYNNIVLFYGAAKNLKDPSGLLEKHLLRTTCTEAAMTLLKYYAAENAIQFDESLTQSSKTRKELWKKFPSTPSTPLFESLFSIVSSSEGTCDQFLEAFHQTADALEVKLRTQDSKERRELSLQHAQQRRDALDKEKNPAAVYQLLMLLMYFHATGDVLHAPGKSLMLIVDNLQKVSPPEIVEDAMSCGLVVREYLTAVVKKDEARVSTLEAQLNSLLPPLVEMSLSHFDSSPPAKINRIPSLVSAAASEPPVSSSPSSSSSSKSSSRKGKKPQKD